MNVSNQSRVQSPLGLTKPLVGSTSTSDKDLKILKFNLP